MSKECFDHQHGVGPCGHGSAGHDGDRFAFLHVTVENLTRSNFSDHRRLTGQVGHAQRVSIPHGAIERRIVAIGVNVVREDTPMGTIQGDRFRSGTNRADFAQHG